MAAGFDQKFARFGLTQAQFRTLLAVWKAGAAGIAPSLLAEQLLIERASVSVLTTRLVERGWLARLPGENRRTFRLALTEAGKEKLQEALPHAVALADATLAGVGQEELRRTLALLEQLEARLREGEKRDAKDFCGAVYRRYKRAICGLSDRIADQQAAGRP